MRSFAVARRSSLVARRSSDAAAARSRALQAPARLEDRPAVRAELEEPLARSSLGAHADWSTLQKAMTDHICLRNRAHCGGPIATVEACHRVALTDVLCGAI